MYLFFFKQKTAYEVRISDWSSDVCSSDLGGLRPPGLGIAADLDARLGAGERNALQIRFRRGGNAREQTSDGHHGRDGGCQVTTMEHEMRPPDACLQALEGCAMPCGFHQPSSDESREG